MNKNKEITNILEDLGLYLDVARIITHMKLEMENEFKKDHIRIEAGNENIKNIEIHIRILRNTSAKIGLWSAENKWEWMINNEFAFLEDLIILQ